MTPKCMIGTDKAKTRVEAMNTGKIPQVFAMKAATIGATAPIILPGRK